MVVNFFFPWDQLSKIPNFNLQAGFFQEEIINGHLVAAPTLEKKIFWLLREEFFAPFNARLDLVATNSVCYGFFWRQNSEQKKIWVMALTFWLCCILDQFSHEDSLVNFLAN